MNDEAIYWRLAALLLVIKWHMIPIFVCNYMHFFSAGVHNQSWIDQETLEQALFERKSHVSPQFFIFFPTPRYNDNSHLDCSFSFHLPCQVQGIFEQYAVYGGTYIRW